MAVQIRTAVKYASRLRMALIGPSGSGKTLTSLLLASAMAGEQGVIVIDTERGSASLRRRSVSNDRTCIPLLHLRGQAMHEVQGNQVCGWFSPQFVGEEWVECPL
jgi:hypothetical protein